MLCFPVLTEKVESIERRILFFVSRVDARLSLLMSAAVNAFPFLGMTLSDVAVRMDESCKGAY